MVWSKQVGGLLFSSITLDKVSLGGIDLEALASYPLDLLCLKNISSSNWNVFDDMLEYNKLHKSLQIGKVSISASSDLCHTVRSNKRLRSLSIDWIQPSAPLVASLPEA